MGWLTALFVARSVDHSVAHTQDRRDPITPQGVALLLGLLAGMVFIIATGVVLALLGVESVSALAVLAVVVVAGVVACVVTGLLVR